MTLFGLTKADSKDFRFYTKPFNHKMTKSLCLALLTAF